MRRCLPGAVDTGGSRCEAIDPGCDALEGAATYTRTAVASCVGELETLSCPAGARTLDPADPAAVDLESRASACKPLVAADAQMASRDRVVSTARASR